jgi:hypothetical protein
LFLPGVTQNVSKISSLVEEPGSSSRSGTGQIQDAENQKFGITDYT